MGDHLTDEPGLKFILGLYSQLAHALLNSLALGPLELRRLITTHMDEERGEDFHHFVEHVTAKGERGLLHIEDVLRDSPVAAHVRSMTGAAQLRIRHQGRLRMAGHFDLGNHSDFPPCSKCYDFTQIILREESSVRNAIVASRTAPLMANKCLPTHRTDFGETRILFDLHSPPLVIGKMQMAYIESVERQKVDIAANFLDGEKMPGHIKVQASPAEARGVFNADLWNHPRFLLQYGGKNSRR